MAVNEVRQFLDHLSIERRVAAASQNQALNAIVFLYRHVLDQSLGEVGSFSRAKCSLRLSLKKRLIAKLRDKSHFLKQNTTELEVLGGCPVMGKSD
nr:phage integrase N-terminal SAM-like domain-containing protein [Halomonas sulfidaeris]